MIFASAVAWKMKIQQVKKQVKWKSKMFSAVPQGHCAAAYTWQYQFSNNNYKKYYFC